MTVLESRGAVAIEIERTDGSAGTASVVWWTSDGTAAGTALVKDIRPGSASSDPRWFAAVGGTLFFAADDPVKGGELWKSDGTAGGTVLVKDIRPGSASSSPQKLTAVGTTLFFTADEGDECEVSYADKQGKYQAQRGITLPKL